MKGRISRSAGRKKLDYHCYNIQMLFIYDLLTTISISDTTQRQKIRVLRNNQMERMRKETALALFRPERIEENHGKGS